MKSRILLAALMMAVLVMPATTALAADAADQDVDVQVLASDFLGINVYGGVGFAIEVGQEAVQTFGMDITNTTAGGWFVTVDGPDLQSYTWDCDQSGCHVRRLTGNTIPKSSVVVTGGDMCFTPGCAADTDSAITAHTVVLGEATPIMEGTAAAHGLFGFNDPYQPTVKVTIPSASVSDSYFTTLTYTIMAP